MLVQLSGVSKSYGSQTVLRDASFQINPAEKIGLIGPNGAGKTTLLKIISRAEEGDDGTVTHRSGLQIGVLSQIPDFHEGTSVIEEGLRASTALLSIEREMSDLEHAIARNPEKDSLERYSQLQHEFEIKGGYSLRARTEAALLGVGFRKEALPRSSSTLSGGEKNRLSLAKLLLSEAELLLLDEPTNHLDIRSIEWLESFLNTTDKTVVVVSHDRFFLDRVARRILEVSGGTIHDYRGNYSAYLKEREERIARQEKEWAQQREWIEKQEDYIRRNLAGQKTKQAQSRRTLLDRVKRIDRPASVSAKARFQFLPVERSGRFVLTTRQLDIGYGEKPLVRSISFEVQRGERWAILGGNGSGKTTLLRTLTGELTPLQGEMQWNEGLDVGYYDQQLQDLNPQGSPIEEIRDLDSDISDGELRSYLAMFLFSGDDVFKQTASLSGGEKSRLMLARLIYSRPQLLALDEPTNHLDIAAREALEGALAGYPGTILFVTHDRYLVQRIATHLIYIEDGKSHVFDRLSAFEEWLTTPAVEASPPPTSPSTIPESTKTGTPMSKNKRDRLQKEISALEEQIADAEKTVQQLEAAFQNPSPGVDWQIVHQQYDEAKSALENLYRDWSGKLEALEEPSEFR